MLSSINFSHLSFCFEIDTIGMRVEKIFAELYNAINETSSSFMYFYLFLFFGRGGGVQQ